jgi:hypothetical protein
LYSVEKPDAIPNLVAFLRNQYRRKFLETVDPDAENGEPPTGNWVQLVGAAYERTIYSYQIETSEEQDDPPIAAPAVQPNNARRRSIQKNSRLQSKQHNGTRPYSRLA